MAGTLKKLAFKPLTVLVLNGGVFSRVLIKWDLEVTTQDLRNLRFFVDRGESPSDLRQLNSGAGILASSLREYVDETGNLLDNQKVYYYRVRAVEFQAGTPVQTFESETTTWDGRLDLAAAYIVEEHVFLHRKVAGVPVMIFKAKHEGGRCPECWDKVLKKVTKSNCTTCFGTGFLGGFYTAIEGWMNFEPDPKAIQLAGFGKIQPNQTDAQFTNYPLMTEDDLIIELKLHKIWKVSIVRAAEKNRTTVLQMLRVSAVNPADVEHRIQVDEDRKRALVAELDARGLEREF